MDGTTISTEKCISVNHFGNNSPEVFSLNIKKINSDNEGCNITGIGIDLNTDELKHLADYLYAVANGKIGFVAMNVPDKKS